MSNQNHGFKFWMAFLCFWILAVFLTSCSPSVMENPKPQNSCGFAQNAFGERLSWKGNLPVEMYVDPSVPPEFLSSIERAAETWNQSAKRKLFKIIFTSKSQGLVQGDGKNVIVYKSTWESGRELEQARTSLAWIGSQLKDADISINAKDFKFYAQDQRTASQNAVSFEALILHELGHALGLKHKEEGGSVMAIYLSAHTDRIAVADTDEVSLACEY